MNTACPICGVVVPEGAVTCPEHGVPAVVVAEEDPLLGTSLAGRYELRGVAGTGGMGRVYVAWQRSMGREVAVKVLHPWLSSNPAVSQRFFHEARAASRLRHPHTIRIFDFGQTDEGLLFMVQELLHGRSLAQALREEGPLGPQRAATIAMQIADGLSEAHEQGVIHRDLKPDNVFLEEVAGHRDFAKVLDFGIAKTELGPSVSTTGAVVGTPAYMSPEQASGEPLDGRSDLYSLGCLLFEMLSGERAFPGSKAMEVMMRHLQPERPVLSAGAQQRVPPSIVALLDCLLALDPADRYANCGALRDDLSAILESMARSATPQPRAADTLDFGAPPVRGAMDRPPAPGRDQAPPEGAQPRAEDAASSAPQPPRERAAALPTPPRRAASSAPPAGVASSAVGSPAPRPTSVLLRGEAGSFELVAADQGLAVLTLRDDTKAPGPGTVLRLAAEGTAHRGLQLTLKTLGSASALGLPSALSTAPQRISHPRPERLLGVAREVFGLDLAGAAEAAEAASAAGELVAWDCAARAFTADRPIPPLEPRNRAPSKPKGRAKRPRRVLEVTSRRGVDGPRGRRGGR